MGIVARKLKLGEESLEAVNDGESDLMSALGVLIEDPGVARRPVRRPQASTDDGQAGQWSEQQCGWSFTGRKVRT